MIQIEKILLDLLDLSYYYYFLLAHNQNMARAKKQSVS